MDWQLRRHPSFPGAKGPVVLAILDGVGVGSGDESDAVRIASTPTLDAMWVAGARCTLTAHGPFVGLPSPKDIGNSEVGHNALGCGRIHDQGALLINRAIASGALFRGDMWRRIVKRCRPGGGALHFLGLLSDGNVHAHIDHLEAMLRRAATDGVARVFVHVLLDGRDVEPVSALRYIDRLEAVLAEISTSETCTAAIASGGGRMSITMDRYEADWPMVKRGYDIHVHGQGRQFESVRHAIATLRDEQPGIIDQNLPGFVIARSGTPIGRMRSGDAVVNINFRGDRAIEISRAFDDDDFPYFDRGDRPEVLYAGVMEYDGDTHVPRHYLVEPPAIEHTMGEVLVRNQITQLAISETQKYGHVTYFWNGNRSGAFDDKLETYVEIPSELTPFEQRPWMKAAEITDRLIAELQTGQHRFARVNYANGDMVGHTGAFDATVLAVQVVDLQLARLRDAVNRLDGVLVVTADHGNADEMYQHASDGTVIRDSTTGVPVVKTSHTLNPVPFMIHDPNRSERYVVADRPDASGIAHVTATCLELLGYNAPEGLQPSLLKFKP